ncbi:MAG: hypothetical protein DMD67_02900 [Gemmatimonadetes bacterium]|nr:MAG: hypothetical protein DMD67_02900 [Gemmatimonadota bacterium]
MIADIFRAAIFVAAHLLGGSIGAGVLAASFMLRLALLPLTLRLARRALAQQRILESIQPEVVAIRQRYRDDPQQQWRKLRALYERAGYRPFNASTVFGNLVQLPVVGAVHSALRVRSSGFPTSRAPIYCLRQRSPWCLVSRATLARTRAAPRVERRSPPRTSPA